MMGSVTTYNRPRERQDGGPRGPCESLPSPSSCCKCRHGRVHVTPSFFYEEIHGLPGDESLRIPRTENRAFVTCGHPTALIPGLVGEYRTVQAVCRHAFEIGEELAEHAEKCGTCSGCEISCQNYEGPFAWEGWTASH